MHNFTNNIFHPDTRQLLFTLCTYCGVRNIDEAARAPCSNAPAANAGATAAAAPAVWDFDHIYVLGDDSEEGRSVAHSTAIAVGRKTILACAHSLQLVDDPSQRSSRTKEFLKYEENYWIQPTVTVTSDGSIGNDGRIPIQLYKFHRENDWALFQRTDGQNFINFAEIDDEPANLPPRTSLVRKPIALLHCPVSLLRNFEDRIGEYTLNCNVNEDVRIQSQSSHHLYYDGSNLVGGSSGGAIHWVENKKLVAMHCEMVNEAVFDEDEGLSKEIAATSKRVTSEAIPYSEVSSTGPPKKKQKTCDSETIRSISCGNQGQGRAIILSKFKTLMHYISEIELS